jgi:3,5-dioxohexanoate:acetyl-CoA acetone transferase
MEEQLVMNKFIVTAAITGGVHTPSMSPFLPITPDQVADEAVRAYEAGAAIVHIHARDPQDGRPSADPELFKEILEKIKSRCDVVICTTTGGGVGQSTEERIKVVKTFSPEMASMNAGTLCFGLFTITDKIEKFKYDWEADYLRSSEHLIFANTFRTLREFSQYFDAEDTKPEFEIYDAGMLNNITFLLSRGNYKKPVHLQFVLGALGGMQATLKNLAFLHSSARDLFGEDFQWSVCAAGREQFKICNMALLMGGNVRVGLEDNLFISKGKLAKSNAEQVEKIIRIAREHDLEPAKPSEARQILNLKGPSKVRF